MRAKNIQLVEWNELNPRQKDIVVEMFSEALFSGSPFKDSQKTSLKGRFNAQAGKVNPIRNISSNVICLKHSGRIVGAAEIHTERDTLEFRHIVCGQKNAGAEEELAFRVMQSGISRGFTAFFIPFTEHFYPVFEKAIRNGIRKGVFPPKTKMPHTAQSPIQIFPKKKAYPKKIKPNELQRRPKSTRRR